MPTAIARRQFPISTIDERCSRADEAITNLFNLCVRSVLHQTSLRALLPLLP
jgi:hypothetical protein